MGCCQSGSQSAVERVDVGAPRPCPPSAEPPEAAREPGGSMSTQECRLAMCLEANKAGSLHPEIYAQVMGSQGGMGSASLSSNSSGGYSSRLPVNHSGTKRSQESELKYADPSQTIIIFDWDDTLCPSTWMRRFAQFDAGGRLAVSLGPDIQSELDVLADQAALLLRHSLALGKVVIVTNARRPWVHTSCAHFLPALKEPLKQIPVLYALELVQDCDRRSDRDCLLTETKVRAMQAAVSEFYSRYPNQSWKNVISIGDAAFEHNAIRQVVDERPTQKRCRTKTVKLLEGPSAAGMVVQLSIMETWLAKIVQLDNDVDVDLGASEEAVDAWVSQFGEPP
mmetsp:Transcript_70776/g.207344  ORF Transcript_70776/g.207344 Transcript_70776/m.207344 type:complete len:338 (+) Transcript_70776:168-1181(+)